MAMIALLIKCTGKGPVFFRQQRIGFQGKRFACLKFRTMKADADAVVHQEHLKNLISSNRPMVKMDALGDARLIPGGKLLRSSGLDELPQLLNVLRGEMSIVGPRPCTPFEFDHYEDWHRKRFNVLPGLTGLWQVSGKNKTTFRQMVLLDLFYAMNARPMLDLRIMLKTLGVLFSQVEENHTLGTPLRSSAYAPRLKNEQMPVT
jgi:exopolysaccharide production protein ExoY